MTEVKLVVFDMAGTTVKDQNEVEKCFVDAAEKTNLPFCREDIMAMMGWSKVSVFQTLWNKARPDFGESEIQRLVSHSFNTFKGILEHHYQTAPVEPTEGCLEIFELLKSKKIKVALTTGFYRKVTNIILSRLNWDQYLDNNYIGNGDSLIDLSVASDEVKSGRPEPYMINRAMRMTGISDSQSVINIGDTPSDLISGKRAQCLYSLGVCNGTHTRTQLAAFPNDGLLANIREIANYLT